MPNNKLITIIVTSIIVLVFFFLPFAEDQNKAKQEEERIAAEEQAALEAEQKEAEAAAQKLLYCAPPKEAEVYDPSADNRAFEVLGAGYSDGSWAGVYGYCPKGVTVTATVDGQEYSVQSQGGTFGIRVNSPNPYPQITFTQSYQGEVIGEPYVWEGSIVTAEPSYDPNQASFIGYENQFFYHKMLPDFTGSNLLSEDEVAALKSRYTSLVESLKTVGDGCEIITVFGPSPATIYPERVPAELGAPASYTRLDQLQEIFADSGAHVIDLRDTFKEHKNDSLELYCLTDSHWTDYAGYLAYVDLYNYISEKYPEAAPRRFDEFNWRRGYYNNEDLLYYVGINSWVAEDYSFRRDFNVEVPEAIRNLTRFSIDSSNAYGSYTDQVVGYNVYSTGNEALPDIYVIRHSYSGQMIDIMAERSNTSTFRQMFDYSLNFDEIAAAAPDYVILTISEWDLWNLL